MKKENLKIIKCKNGKFKVLDLTIKGLQIVASGMTKSQAAQYVINRLNGFPF